MSSTRQLPRKFTSGLAALALSASGAVLLRLLTGVGFANYDTLYALLWGGQLARGQDPQYAIPIAPTPHPLMELLGTIAEPLGAHAAEQIAVWVGYLALAACGLLAYKLATRWFNWPTGLLSALILLSRAEILSYGSRAYIDVPFLALMLAALLVESRRRRAGAPVLLLLAVAGLLRPEAWVFSGLYWLYLAADGRLSLNSGRDAARPRIRWIGADARQQHPAAFSPAKLGALGAVMLSAPLIWALSDLAVTGNILWSLTHTKQTAGTLDRITGLANVPEYIPRRIGEIVRPAELVGAALGGVLTLLYLTSRALIGALAGLVAVAIFAALAGFGLPIDTRYAFLAAAILCIFSAAGVFGWLLLPAGHRARRPWALAGTLVLIGMVASLPGQIDESRRQMNRLARQQQIKSSLLALLGSGPDPRECLPVGVPNHAPIPLLALYLQIRPGEVRSAQVQPIAAGTYFEAASPRILREYTLDPHEPKRFAVRVPPGFSEAARNSDWVEFRRCSAPAGAVR